MTSGPYCGPREDAPSAVPDALTPKEIFMSIEQAELKVVDPEWKSLRPPDRVMLASNGSVSVVLDHIGPSIAYWEDTAGLANEFTNLPAGVLIVEVDVRSWRCETMDGVDYDAELETLSVRSATDDETHAQAEGEYPWDRSLWLKAP